mgnify:CR=1 FL=1
MRTPHPKLAEIIEAIKAGDRYAEIAERFGIKTAQRISQIAIQAGIRKNSYIAKPRKPD